MGRPRLHDEKTERELLAAAEALLAAEGVEGLSVRRLAEAAGTSSRAIYSVFGGRDGLVRALFREGFVALDARLATLPETDDLAADLVAAGVEGFRGWALARPQLFRLLFEARPPPIAPGPAESDPGVRAFGRLVAKVGRCTAAGLMPRGREREIALSVHALCEGLTGLELRGRFPLSPAHDPEAAWRQSLSALVRGYRA
jgi:AcrR family transcriptional regulator